MQTRRSILAGAGAVALSSNLSWAALGNPVCVSAAKQPDGLDMIVGLRADGSLAFSIPLPARGHAAAVHPLQAEVVAIARRPGAFALVVECAQGKIIGRLDAPTDRHFYGHGAFSQDGHLLFTTENDLRSGMGRIGVWDRRQGYRRIAELASGGVGPHEILRMPNGHLAVANGGIKTHPTSGRDKLNLDTMQSNLCIFTGDGALLDRAEVPRQIHQNSLRHIAVQSDGTIACGFQWQGDPFDAPPLIAMYRGRGMLHAAHMPAALLRTLDGYIGSVSAHGVDGFVASSPRGGRVFEISASGDVQPAYTAADVCGVAKCEMGQTIVTDGHGRVYDLAPQRLSLQKQHDLAFDNHLVAI